MTALPRSPTTRTTARRAPTGRRPCWSTARSPTTTAGPSPRWSIAAVAWACTSSSGPSSCPGCGNGKTPARAPTSRASSRPTASVAVAPTIAPAAPCVSWSPARSKRTTWRLVYLIRLRRLRRSLSGWALQPDRVAGMSTSTATPSNVYESLGITPVINARGNNTMLGGSTPSPRVRRAMQDVERYYVDVQQLLERSGQVIAGLLNAEAAYVTPGAAAALALGAAACITGNDPDKIARVPETTGMANTILIQAGHHYHYQRAVTVPGGRLV